MKKKSNLILFHDNHIIIANKPRGLLTQPTDQSPFSLEKDVKEWAKGFYEKKGEVFLHVVHRLDQVVSGIVLFAKTSKALSRLNELQKQKKILKIYVAEVEGCVLQEKKTLVHYLKHDDHFAKAFTTQTKDALESSLEFTVLERKEKSTILKIILHTGRYHQIRAQLSAYGFPILGDVKYGAKKIADPGIHLHHAYLEFDHPVTKEKIKIFSPPDFFMHATI
jgi:23S rRNA pseudouridine1911/1915/1917 synthase